jgi:hypothetical protein
MQTYRAPGVRIEHILSEPARVLRTGVPVFLGLVSKAAIEAWNAKQSNPEERYLCKLLRGDLGPSIVRKQDYLKLPGRTSDAAVEPQISDRSSSDLTMYLRTMPLTARSASSRAKVRSTGGAAGPGLAPAAPDGSLLKSIGAKPQRFTAWPQFQQTYGDLASAGFLSYAVRGFFENGGTLCYVQLISYREPTRAPSGLEEALAAGLDSLAPYDDYDLVCVPDIMWEATLPADIGWIAKLQNSILAHCASLGERMAILDSLGGKDMSAVDVQAQRDLLDGEYGALYYPWVRVPGGPERTAGYVPPCGHVAGVYARADGRVGVHKAPANEVVEGVIDLSVHLSDDDQGPLNDVSINCLRAFPRRGIRVWGARTLSRGATWRYVNVRRVILTAARWITYNMNDVVFEPHSPRLWGRITRELNAYFGDLAQRGALAGPPDEEAFYVKCDAETNPPEMRETGRIVTEIGLRPAAPAEFIVIRIIHGPTGAEITTE